MSEQNGVNTKVAVLIEKVDNMEEQLLHKMRNHENQLKLLYDDITDIQNRLKYIIIGALAAFAATTRGGIEFIKTLM